MPKKNPSGRRVQLSALQRQIKTRREALGLTQRALAAKIASDRTETKIASAQSRIAHWERGKNDPQAGILPAVAKALKTTVAALYGEAA